MAGCHRRRKSSPIVLAAVGLWAGLAAEAAAQGSVATDRAALEALYDATGGPGWTENTNWKTSAPLDDWHGVTIDASSSRVTRLELRDNGLAGPIPPALGDLDNLSLLNLSLNDLSGPVPAWLGNMTGLQALYLSGNELTGRIPDALGNLVNLWGLGLSWNDLSGGPVPAWLGNLTSLRWLYLSGSGLTGPIPNHLARLGNLRSLYLRRNALTGPIPAWLGNLAGLEDLSLDGNPLTGPIPDVLGSLTNLETLDLSEAWGLSPGPVPAGLRRLSGLRDLDIFQTRTCAPAAWQDWLKTIGFNGRLCGAGAGATVDVAVVYTPAARARGGRDGRDRGGDRPHGRGNQPGLRGERGGPPRGAGPAGPRWRTPRPRTPPSSSTVSGTRRTATWTRRTPCATGSGPTSCT